MARNKKGTPPNDQRKEIGRILQVSWDFIARDVDAMLRRGVDVSDWCAIIVDRKSRLSKKLQRLDPKVHDFLSQLEPVGQGIAMRIFEIDFVSRTIGALAPDSMIGPKIVMTRPEHLGVVVIGPSIFYIQIDEKQWLDGRAPDVVHVIHESEAPGLRNTYRRSVPN
jgi:hypothetical protein